MTNLTELWERRRAMGIAPLEEGSGETKFFRGVEEIKVGLVPGSYPSNPYRSLYTMATATWGGVWDVERWETVTPEARFDVVKAVIGRKSLPNAMEVPSFLFEIAGPSRSSFDQMARARIGAVFGSMGWRDNNHSDIDFRVPDTIWDNDVAFAEFTEVIKYMKSGLGDYLETPHANWQDGRAFIPISACHRYTMGINYMALQNLMSKRLMFSEQPDTVATAWLIREEVLRAFPLLGRYLRPQSDHSQRCMEHVGDEVAQSFGNLFKCSGRWPCDMAAERFTFEGSCTDREVIMEQLGIYIPEGPEDLPGDETFEDLTMGDRYLFCLGDKGVGQE